jgi:hypothetical protein
MDHLESPDEAPEMVAARYTRNTERVLWWMLGFAGVLAIVLGVVFMLAIGGGRSHLAGRLAVAVAAILVLGAIDTQATRLMRRRRPILAPDPPGYRRVVMRSALAFLGAAALLLAVAWYLPE